MNNPFLGKKNTIIFDDIALEKDFRTFLKKVLSSDSCFSIFNKEISLVSMDELIRSDSYFPCVTIEVINEGIEMLASDSLQIQNMTNFATEIQIFTSGKNKRLHNMQLCNIIIKEMQEHFGLKFDDVQEVGTPDSNINRRVLRASNTIDNVNRIIY